ARRPSAWGWPRQGASARHPTTLTAESCDLRARSRTVTRSWTSADDVSTRAPERAPLACSSSSLATRSPTLAAIPLILISGPLDTLMITPGMLDFRASAAAPGLAAVDGLAPLASRRLPNLLNVDDSMKNIRRS